MFTKKITTQVLNKWSNIRTHAFINTWIQIMRRKLSREIVEKTDKFPKKGEASMWKSLTWTFLSGVYSFTFQRRIQKPVKNQRWIVLRQLLTTLSHFLKYCLTCFEWVVKAPAILEFIMLAIPNIPKMFPYYLPPK